MRYIVLYMIHYMWSVGSRRNKFGVCNCNCKQTFEKTLLLINVRHAEAPTATVKILITKKYTNKATYNCYERFNFEKEEKQKLLDG